MEGNKERLKPYDEYGTGFIHTNCRGRLVRLILLTHDGDIHEG